MTSQTKRDGIKLVIKDSPRQMQTHPYKLKYQRPNRTQVFPHSEQNLKATDSEEDMGGHFDQNVDVSLLMK